MTHAAFRELLAQAADIGMIAHIEVIGRGNYRNKRKLNRIFRLDLSQKKMHVLQRNPFPLMYAIQYVIRETKYRRRYQVVINFQNHGRPYARRISAKEFIQKKYEEIALLYFTTKSEEE